MGEKYKPDTAHTRSNCIELIIKGLKNFGRDWLQPMMEYLKVNMVKIHNSITMSGHISLCGHEFGSPRSGHFTISE